MITTNPAVTEADVERAREIAAAYSGSGTYAIAECIAVDRVRVRIELLTELADDLASRGPQSQLREFRLRNHIAEERAKLDR